MVPSLINTYLARGFWVDESNQRAFLDKVAAELGIQQVFTTAITTRLTSNSLQIGISTPDRISTIAVVRDYLSGIDLCHKFLKPYIRSIPGKPLGLWRAVTRPEAIGRTKIISCKCSLKPKRN